MLCQPAKTMDFQVFAVLPAGGCGQRTGLDVPKQFVDVCGRPLIVYTLETFQSIPWISRIIVAVAPEWESRVRDLIGQHGLSKVELTNGGTTRHRSIQNGVQHLRSEGCGNLRNGDALSGGGEVVARRPGDDREAVVIVHDAVRPFADEAILRRVALAAHEYGAAGAVLPLVSTIIESDPQDMLVRSLLRSKLKESHTPQAFQWNILDSAYQKISEHELDHGTEVLELALKYTGCHAKLVEAPDYVWKVTYKKDFVAAESFARAYSAEIYLLTDKAASSKTLTILQDRLASRHLKVSVASTFPDVARQGHTSVVLHLVRASVDEATTRCLEILEGLISGSSRGGLLLCMCQLADSRDETLGQHRRLLRRLAERGRDAKVQVTFVVHTATDGKNNEEMLSRVCDMAASVLYDRNPLMSGQLLVLSDQD